MTRERLRAIQGNLAGFNKDHQRFVFLRFTDTVSARNFVRALEPDIASAYEVRAFNRVFKEIHTRRHAEPGIVEASWTNIAFTFHGLEILGLEALDALPTDFKDGMAARASLIGDLEDSAPATWEAPFNDAPIDAMVILAADTEPDLIEAYDRLQQKITGSGIAEAQPHLDGNVRPEPNVGHEHFGFRDGVSQPAIAGLAESSKRGSEVVAPGEFLIGWPDETGATAGEAVAAPTSGQPGYPNTPAQPALPEWTRDGSFVVFRRLRQNVGAFNQFLTEQATAQGLSEDLLGAKLVGRWKSGAPLENTLHAPAADPAAGDPASSNPSILSDHHVNDFVYAPDDADGHLVPRAAHIRKANPRNEDPPSAVETRRHRILRRGVPYGTEFQATEPPYPGAAGPVAPDQDRGLLFLCYQASLSRGFEFIQQSWANQPDFPQAADGRDPIISQDVSPRDFNLGPSNPHLAISRWVATTRGGYFFAPSIPALKEWGKP
jgi:Dyp-type peroxidase family